MQVSRKMAPEPMERKDFPTVESVIALLQKKHNFHSIDGTKKVVYGTVCIQNFDIEGNLYHHSRFEDSNVFEIFINGKLQHEIISETDVAEKIFKVLSETTLRVEYI